MADKDVSALSVLSAFGDEHLRARTGKDRNLTISEIIFCHYKWHDKLLVNNAHLYSGQKFLINAP